MAKKVIKGLGTYTPSAEETKWYMYCVENNIRISPIAKEKGMGNTEWYIGISFGNNYKKIHKSPSVYTRDNIWEEFYLMCKYYYEKHRN